MFFALRARDTVAAASSSRLAAIAGSTSSLSACWIARRLTCSAAHSTGGLIDRPYRSVGLTRNATILTCLTGHTNSRTRYILPTRSETGKPPQRPSASFNMAEYHRKTKPQFILAFDFHNSGFCLPELSRPHRPSWDSDRPLMPDTAAWLRLTPVRFATSAVHATSKSFVGQKPLAARSAIVPASSLSRVMRSTSPSRANLSSESPVETSESVRLHLLHIGQPTSRRRGPFGARTASEDTKAR